MFEGYMYILLCADGTFYTGSTRFLNQRLKEHQDGVGCNYTCQRLPVRLVYYERFNHVALAYFREKQIQGWKHDKKVALILGHFDVLKGWSKRNKGASTLR